MALPAGWIVPDWPAPPNVRAACSTRVGGRSRGPYESLNLGEHVGDDVGAVAANRAIFSDALGVRPVFLEQVHGQQTLLLSDTTPDGTQADGCVAIARGLACTIMVADCLPVLFTVDSGSVVAAAHAGWRGLSGQHGQGVLESVTLQLGAVDGARPAELMAWLGPCIGPEVFEVGPEVKAAFEAHDPEAAALFKPHAAGKWLADLPELARRRLRALGVTRIYGNDGSRGWCTVSNPSRFFSHRRDRVSGRFAAAIWRA
ncbi:MAG: peptidoglycan editing factor PgeF [Ramlibacter sp.]|nr:peptidoglycan editing factor PgeF [Ramlibacter sp.]